MIRHFVRWPRALVVGFCTAGLSACTALPGSGPLRQDIVEERAQVQGQFTVVEINQHSLEILQRRPAVSLSGSFHDRRPSGDQRIGIGDAVSVTIWEAAAGGLFSAPAVDRLGPGSRSAVIPEQVVGRDRSITVPYAGRIPVVGKTTADVERDIVQRLREKAIEPQVLVTIPRNTSNTVTVTGDVTNGAVVPINVRGQRLLDVIALAGGTNAPVHETFVSLVRANTAVRVPLQSVLTRPAENIYVQPGDVVALVRTPQTFSAIGATGQNAVVPFGNSALTLEEALSKAGGLVDHRSDPEGVFVLRYEPDDLVAQLVAPQPFERRNARVPVSYRINLRDPSALFGARLFAMRDKDIIYVANAPLNEVQKVFVLVNTITSPVFTAATVRAVTR
ncbi:MAG: polysaccharide biosynthesis/export family protein [Rhizobiales bacterium]|nr:polysaccharide biosynthesis/export family protein [Hyphomicrobiales bacterium]